MASSVSEFELENELGCYASPRLKAVKVFALRLRPGQDLKQSLQEFVVAQQIQAGFILTTVGSLQQATLRLANQSTGETFSGKFEIVSLVGTLARNGSHLHLAIADSTGKTLGGYVLGGCIIYTTAEIVIGAIEEYVFDRSFDEKTGFYELEIKDK